LPRARPPPYFRPCCPSSSITPGGSQGLAGSAPARQPPPPPHSHPAPSRLFGPVPTQPTRTHARTRPLARTPQPAGLVAQQQCCGPLQLPVADVAVFAQTHTGVAGSATSIGEQPIKGLIDPEAMARLALGEAVTNLCLVRGGPAPAWSQGRTDREARRGERQ
jgi:hypothetical protein